MLNSIFTGTLPIVFALGLVGCGGSPTVPSTTTPLLHGEVSDLVGDALPDASVSVSPDLVRGTADVAAGTITFIIQFATGTFDRLSTRVAIDLDTDQNVSTGINTGNLGIDYAVDLWAPASQTTISKAVPTGTCTVSNPCYADVGVAPLTLLTDGMQVTVPLSFFGNASGPFNFRVIAYTMRVGTPPTVPTITLDVMPDITLAPGRVQ